MNSHYEHFPVENINTIWIYESPNLATLILTDLGILENLLHDSIRHWTRFTTIIVIKNLIVISYLFSFYVPLWLFALFKHHLWIVLLLLIHHLVLTSKLLLHAHSWLLIKLLLLLSHHHLLLLFHLLLHLFFLLSHINWRN